jgi:hypothetical protein
MADARGRYHGVRQASFLRLLPVNLAGVARGTEAALTSGERTVF